MLIVAGQIRIQPGSLQMALPIIHTMEQATHAEAGCLAYRFYTDPQDETILFVYEEWADEAALKAHGESAHMAAFRAEWPRFLAEPPKLTRYQAEPTG